MSKVPNVASPPKASVAGRASGAQHPVPTQGEQLDEIDYSGAENDDLAEKDKCLIIVKLNGEKTDSVTVIMAMQYPFHKLLKRFAQTKGVDPSDCRLFDENGDRMENDSTPNGMKWKAGRTFTIDCMVKVTGGC